MILMAPCAVLCGADGCVDVAEWAKDNEAWLKRYLVLQQGHAPLNFAVLSQFAHALLRQDKQYSKRSLRSRRNIAETTPRLPRINVRSQTSAVNAIALRYQH